MLSRSQKYSIASTLATSTLEQVLGRLSQNQFASPDEIKEAQEFAWSIEPFYDRRKGLYIPQQVIKLINQSKEQDRE